MVGGLLIALSAYAAGGSYTAFTSTCSDTINTCNTNPETGEKTGGIETATGTGISCVSGGSDACQNVLCVPWPYIKSSCP